MDQYKIITAISYGEYFRRSGPDSESMVLTDLGCRGSENSLIDCCATESPAGLKCHSGEYAGVRCMVKCCGIAHYILSLQLSVMCMI